MIVIRESGVNRQKSGVKIRMKCTPRIVHFGMVHGTAKMALGAVPIHAFSALN